MDKARPKFALAGKDKSTVCDAGLGHLAKSRNAKLKWLVEIHYGSLESIKLAVLLGGLRYVVDDEITGLFNCH